MKPVGILWFYALHIKKSVDEKCHVLFVKQVKDIHKPGIFTSEMVHMASPSQYKSIGDFQTLLYFMRMMSDSKESSILQKKICNLFQKEKQNKTINTPGFCCNKNKYINT